MAVTFAVKNLDEKRLPFGLGGHPGFRVPLVPDTSFEDYELCFSHACAPDRVGFTEDLLLSGRDQPYPLQGGNILPLRHALFDEDAIVLKNMARSVTLRSSKTNRSVTVSYPDMPYLGIWHAPKTDAPYVCLEPWLSLPSRQGIVEELYSKSELKQLEPGGGYENTWSITIRE